MHSLDYTDFVKYLLDTNTMLLDSIPITVCALYAYYTRYVYSFLTNSYILFIILLVHALTLEFGVNHFWMGLGKFGYIRLEMFCEACHDRPDATNKAF